MLKGWEKAREMHMQEIAWQTCHIINCCGHLKKPIRIDDLIGKKNEVKEATDDDRDNFKWMIERYG